MPQNVPEHWYVLRHREMKEFTDKYVIYTDVIPATKILEVLLLPFALRQTDMLRDILSLLNLCSTSGFLTCHVAINPGYTDMPD